MVLDGTTTPTGVYVEQINRPGFDQRTNPFHVTHDASPRYGLFNSGRNLPVFGKPTANGKFTEVIIDGVTVYTENSPARQSFGP